MKTDLARLSESKGRIPYASFTGRDLLSSNSPVPEFVLSPWLHEGQNVMIYADTGVGKTWFAMTLAWVIAGGGEVGQWQTNKPRRVLYIDGEMPKSNLEARLKILAEGYRDIIDPKVAGENILFVPRLAQLGDQERAKGDAKGKPLPWVDLASDKGREQLAKPVVNGLDDL